MQNARTEVGQLGRFAERHDLESVRVRDEGRISRHDTVDIGPDPNFIRLQTGPQDRGGHIGAVTADGGGFPVLSAPQKAGDHGDGSSLQQRFELLVHQGLSSV